MPMKFTQYIPILRRRFGSAWVCVDLGAVGPDYSWTVMPKYLNDRAGSIYAGDTMVGRGRVVAKRCDTTADPPRQLLDLQIEITNQRGELCCPVELTLQLSEHG